MINLKNPSISIVRQCQLLSVNRSSIYYHPIPENELNLSLMKRIDRIATDNPVYGTRQIVRCLLRDGVIASRKLVSRLMSVMGIIPIYQKPNTSKPHPTHQIHPYLLKGLEIDRPNQVWCCDITYIPMKKGFLYLVAVMDWYSRRILAWRLSNTMEVDFCIEALEEALARYGKPEIFNTDQGSQFTSPKFTTVLKNAQILISMDGRGRWMDNVFIERFWRTLKYDYVYRFCCETGSELRKGLHQWISHYNDERPHSTFGIRTPSEVYWGLNLSPKTLAA